MKRKLSEYDRQNISTQRNQDWKGFDHSNAGHSVGRGIGHVSASWEAYKHPGARLFGVNHDQGAVTTSGPRRTRSLRCLGSYC